MKRIALAFVAILGLTTVAFGQGQINFFTFNNNTLFGQVYLPGTTESVNNLFSAQLAVSSTANGVFAEIGSVGDFAGGGPGNPSAVNVGNINVTGFDAGQTVFYKLLVWNDAAGASYTAASGSPSGIVGTSQAVSVVLGGTPPGGGAGIPVPIANGFTSFALAAVPEPSVIALGILGAAAVILRRRKV
jgi:hypothetical protein